MRGNGKKKNGNAVRLLSDWEKVFAKHGTSKFIQGDDVKLNPRGCSILRHTYKDKVKSDTGVVLGAWRCKHKRHKRYMVRLNTKKNDRDVVLYSYEMNPLM